MTRNTIYTVLGFLLLPTFGTAQDSTGKRKNWFITANINVYQPLGNEQKARFPVIGYDAETKPAVQIGGFGVGAARTIRFKEKSYFKFAANFSKHTFWDEPIAMVDVNAQPIGTLHRWASDFNFNSLITIHHKVSKSISFGSGLGLHSNLVSITAVPYWKQDPNNIFNQEQITEGARIGYYKRFIPFIPLEINLLRTKMTYSLRYEQAILNKMKRPLATSIRDNYGIFYFEAAWKIK